MALEHVKEHGGAIIYLQQEGRGIGLANKIAAYALQDGGMDTVDANLHLGFPEDNRQYGVIASILKDMKIDSIELMTNNPRKVDRLLSLGIKVEKTVPMVVHRANEHNIHYLETKQRRMNHKNFGDMLERDLKPTGSNGVMTPKKTTNLEETFLKSGEGAATNAVQVSLKDAADMAGVTARNDGYCFGRKSVEDAIAAVARGEMVCIVDDMDRENEGDLIMASDLCTPEMMAKIIRYSSGVICCAMEGDRMDELELPPMVVNNEDPKETAFSVSVDASKEQGTFQRRSICLCVMKIQKMYVSLTLLQSSGITTGISARDRAVTVQLLANGKATAGDFSRPGHIFPLRAKAGGVLERDGHTEATVDIARMAGLAPCGVLCEIVSEENPTEMARLPELVKFCETHDLVLTSIVDMQQYRRDTEQ
jgi:3,4-dihydroxy 2-butanone 4-phosphate synthase/GTP cyclohydrolase II